MSPSRTGRPFRPPIGMFLRSLEVLTILEAQREPGFHLAIAGVEPVEPQTPEREAEDPGEILRR